MEILLFVVGLLVGLLGGAMLVDNNWRRNAHNPQRILKGGSFYKVVLVDYLKSWDLAHMHFDFPNVSRKVDR